MGSKRTFWEVHKSLVMFSCSIHLGFANLKERAGAMVSLQPGGCDGT